MAKKTAIDYEIVSDPNVPYRHPMASGFIRLDDQSQLAMFRVAGRAWEANDQDEIDGWASALNTLARNIASPRLALMVHVVRSRSRSPYPTGRFRSAFAARLDHAYRDRLTQQLYSTEIYLSVLRRPIATAGFRGLSQRQLALADSPAEVSKGLEDTLAVITAELRPYGLRRLGLRQEGERLFVEPAEALAFILSNRVIMVPLVSGRLGRTIHQDRFIIGRETIEIRSDETYFAAVLGLKEYPTPTSAGHFDTLLRAPYHYVLSQGFAFLSKQDGMDVLTRKQNQMVAAGDKAFEQKDELTQAANDLQSNRFVMGSHHLSLTVFADTLPALRKVVAQARSDLAESGAVVVREDLGNEGAFWAQLPGNERRRPRPGVITSENFADMNSLHNYPAGAAQGYWGTPVARFRTLGGTPYDFHFHVGDLGNVFLCGPAGSGKTTLLLFLLAMAEKQHASTVFFDYGRGGEIFSRAVGGSYLVAPSGEDTGWAPLRGLSNTTDDVAFLCAWIRGLIAKDGYAPTPDDERRIYRGVTALLKLDPALRSMGELRAFLGQREMAGAGARLDRWCAGKAFGWAFDGPKDQTDLSYPYVGYDMTAVLDDAEVRGPAMAYMFHRIESLLDGRRIVVAIDEFWRALADPAFSDMVNEKLKTIRKRNGVVILATQSPRDALNSPISHTIIEQCPTQIFMPNPRASREDYIGGMKLTETEFQLVKEDMTLGSHPFLVKQGTVSVTCGLDLSHAQNCIAVLSGRENTVRLMEQIIRAAGAADPEVWLDKFMTRALEEIA